MKKLLSALLIALVGSTYADQSVMLGGNVFQSIDSDKNATTRVTVERWFDNNHEYVPRKIPQDFGISYSQVMYRNSNSYHWAELVSVLADYRYKDYSVFGRAGIGTMSTSKPYFAGDITASKVVNKDVTVYASVFGDVVDSDAGLKNGITYTGYNVSTDLYNRYGGVSLGAAQTFYSNGNIRNSGNVKLYADVVDGVNVYVRKNMYHNTQPYNAFFWSPDRYQRYLFGVGWRQRIPATNLIVSGWVDTGTQTVDNVRSPAHTARLTINQIPNKHGSWGVTFVSDLNQGSNYHYNSIDVHYRHEF